MEDVYNARYLAIVTPNQDRVYGTLSPRTHASDTKAAFDPSLPVYIAVDPGGVYAVGALQVKTLEGIGPALCLIDEIYFPRTITTPEVQRECSAREWWNNVGTGRTTTVSLM